MPNEKIARRYAQAKTGDAAVRRANGKETEISKFRVTVYKATVLSFLSQADHYERFDLTSAETLHEISARLARDGFESKPGVWVMPGAILEVRKI